MRACMLFARNCLDIAGSTIDFVAVHLYGKTISSHLLRDMHTNTMHTSQDNYYRHNAVQKCGWLQHHFAHACYVSHYTVIKLTDAFALTSPALFCLLSVGIQVEGEAYF